MSEPANPFFAASIYEFLILKTHLRKHSSLVWAVLTLKTLSQYCKQAQKNARRNFSAILILQMMGPCKKKITTLT